MFKIEDIASVEYQGIKLKMERNIEIITYVMCLF